jgi:hypothetical protein
MTDLPIVLLWSPRSAFVDEESQIERALPQPHQVAWSKFRKRIAIRISHPACHLDDALKKPCRYWQETGTEPVSPPQNRPKNLPLLDRELLKSLRAESDTWEQVAMAIRSALSCQRRDHHKHGAPDHNLERRR